MNFTYILALSCAILLVLLIAQSVRILREDERLFVLEMGKMTGHLGPGLVVILPGAKTYVSVIIGDPGELLGPKIAHINGYHLPVRLDPPGNAPLPSLVRVAGFNDSQIIVTLAEGPRAHELNEDRDA